MHYKPQDLRLDLGVYFLNYHDKMPVLEARADGQLQWKYLENRQLYGASANFPLGNWAVGMELSYRPKEAVSLSSCYGQGGALDSITNGVVGIECPMWIDKQKYQAHLTGILLLKSKPGGNMLFGMPLFHVGGSLTQVLTTLTSGGCLVVLSPAGWRNPNAVKNIWQLVERFKQTFRVVKPIKPKASRDKSAETFLVGIGLKR